MFFCGFSLIYISTGGCSHENGHCLYILYLYGIIIASCTFCPVRQVNKRFCHRITEWVSEQANERVRFCTLEYVWCGSLVANGNARKKGFQTLNYGDTETECRRWPRCSAFHFSNIKQIKGDLFISGVKTFILSVKPFGIRVDKNTSTNIHIFIYIYMDICVLCTAHLAIRIQTIEASRDFPWCYYSS